MKQFNIYKSTMKYLTDKSLSLNAKGFLSIVLFNDEIIGLDIEKYCTDDKETIKDALRNHAQILKSFQRLHNFDFYGSIWKKLMNLMFVSFLFYINKFQILVMYSYEIVFLSIISNINYAYLFLLSK